MSDPCLRHVQELVYDIAKVLYMVLYPRHTEMESKLMKKKNISSLCDEATAKRDGARLGESTNYRGVEHMRV